MVRLQWPHAGCPCPAPALALTRRDNTGHTSHRGAAAQGHLRPGVVELADGCRGPRLLQHVQPTVGEAVETLDVCTRTVVRQDPA